MEILHVFSVLETAEAFFDGQFRYLSNQGYNLHLICRGDDCRIAEFSLRNRLKGYLSIAISRKITPISDLKGIYKICSYIHHYKINVVVGHTPKGALLSMIAAFIMRIPKRIYYRHGVVYTTQIGIKRVILKIEEQFVSILATKIICVSPSLFQLSIKEHLNSAAKQRIIGAGTCGGIDAIHKFNPNSLDPLKKDALLRQYNLRSSQFIVGFCGRLCRDKGIVELVEGFTLFLSKYPQYDVILMLIGVFDERDSLPKDTIEEITSNRNIIYTGYVRSDIEYYYSLIDIFVFPSYREGFGMCVLEASAMEKAVLVSRSHGCIDSIQDGITGYYIEITPQDICKRIEQLYNSNLRFQLGRLGRKFVLEYFDHSVMWPQILNLYQSI